MHRLTSPPCFPLVKTLTSKPSQIPAAGNLPQLSMQPGEEPKAALTARRTPTPLNHTCRQ